MLVIGILIGAILATGGFLIYNKVHSNNAMPTTNQGRQMPFGEKGKRTNNGEQEKMPSGNRKQKKNQEQATDGKTQNTEQQDGKLPEKQDNNGQKPEGEPPEIPSESNRERPTKTTKSANDSTNNI